MHAIGIGELSRLTGVKIETIRWYERVRLLPSPVRSESRRRRYAEGDVLRLRFVRRARELGFGLDRVRKLLRLAGDGRNPCRDARVLAQQHLAEVRGKIGALRAMERALAGTVERCSRGKPAVCPLLETLSNRG